MLCYIRFFTLFCYKCLFSIVIIILFLFLFLIFYNFSSCVSKRRWSYIEFVAISYICVVLFVFIILWLLLSFQRDFPSWNFRVKINSFLSFFFSGDSYMETYCKFYFTYFYDFKDCFYLLSGFYCAECIMSLEYFNGIVSWQRLLLMGLNLARIRSPLFQEDYAVCDNLYSATYKECFYIDF